MFVTERKGEKRYYLKYHSWKLEAEHATILERQIGNTIKRLERENDFFSYNLFHGTDGDDFAKGLRTLEITLHLKIMG